MQPQPKPVTGAIFGFLFGVVIVALLWQLGLVPPDRLVVFGIVAIVTMVSTFALTQRVSLVRKRFVVVVVFAALLGGVALTGIPEFVSGGSLSSGCTIEASSSLNDTTSLADTSATSPFRAELTDDVPWTFSTGTVVTTGASAAGLMVAGFEIPTITGTLENPAGIQEISGSASVQDMQDDLKDASGLALTGIYHVYGYVHAPEGNCEGDGYLLVAPAGAFANPVLIGLWALTAILFVVIVVFAIGVRRSIRASERLAATTPPAVAAADSATTTTAPMAPPADAVDTDAPPPNPAPTDAATQEPGPEPAAGAEQVAAPEPAPAADTAATSPHRSEDTEQPSDAPSEEPTQPDDGDQHHQI